MLARVPDVTGTATGTATVIVIADGKFIVKRAAGAITGGAMVVVIATATGIVTATKVRRT